MSAYLLDWLSLLGRWLHLVAGIAWIGSSFYSSGSISPRSTRRPCTGPARCGWRVVVSARRRFLQRAQVPCGARDTATYASLVLLGSLYHVPLGFFCCASLLRPAEVYLVDTTGGPVETRGHCHRIAFLIAVVDLRRPVPLAAGRNARTLAVVLTVLLSAAAWALCHLFSDAAPTWSSAQCWARSWWRMCFSSSFLVSASRASQTGGT